MASRDKAHGVKLLDLYCGAGGAAVGYHRAGFQTIVGVDIKPQPHFPFAFVQADALEYLADHGHEYDAIHASPPCQRYTKATPDPSRHWDSVPPTRLGLQAIGRPYVIENVPGSPLRPAFIITGDMVGLPLLRRERWFETNWATALILHIRTERNGRTICVVGHGTPSWTRAAWGRCIKIAEMREAMGIGWMNRDELSQAIPPAYTEMIGRQLLAYLATEVLA